ncbi:MAG TPA: hypothetical protein VFA83_24170 [Acidimicrobiales bacterium]|nr:hypothetical protein [Acidimicrobiales bacterium]
MSDIHSEDAAGATDEQLPLPQPERGRGPLRLAAIWIGIVAVLAGTVVAVVLANSGGGSDSPTGAVQKLVGAAANVDALGMLDSLPPSERTALQGGLVDVTTELKRLKVLSADTDLHKIKGLDFKFDNLKFKTTPLADGITTVEITAGTAHNTVNIKALPMGDFLHKMLDEQLKDAPASQTDTSSIDSGSPVSMVTVKEGGHWYVSLAYTIAEAARKNSGRPAPSFGHGLQARGEATPEKAVESLLRSFTTLDVQRMLELLPPDEARALDDYAPMFLDDAKQSAADAAKSFRATIDDIGLSSDKSGDAATVHVSRLALTVTVDKLRASVRFQGQCVDVNVLGLPARDLADLPPQLKGGKGHICQNDAQTKDTLGFLPNFSSLHGGIVAVQRNGSWYISPTRTFFGAITSVLRTLQPDDLSKAVDSFQQRFAGTPSSSQLTS